VTANPVRVFFPCTGLGHELRGFEAFTRECAAAVRRDPRVDVTVFGGGGSLGPSERAVWSLPRSGRAAHVLGAALRRDPYFIEQASFFAGFVPALMAGTPDVVYFADLNLGNACWHWRRVTGQSFKLLYYNGGPTTRSFTRCDLVQQVTPGHLASAVARGERENRQVLLPHGLAVERAYHPSSQAERIAARAALGVPADTPVILSVGALNASHKRMDYVISEVAAMQSPAHLLLIGANTDETAGIRARGAELLAGRCTIVTLPRESVRAAYRAADLFVLASLTEGFGIAQLEALDAGLPCVAHDTPTSAFVLGPHGTRADLRAAGALAVMLDRTLAAGRPTDADAAARHEWVFSQFGWERLAPMYCDLFVACAAGQRPPWAPTV